MSNVVPAGGQASVVLPPGWTSSPGRETSQSQNGMVVQGMTFTLTNPTIPVSTSIFVPYSVMPIVAAVQQLFEQRIAAITAVSG